MRSSFQYQHLQANESVQAYLRSFQHEKHRWNELVEATLLYGIHCISQNYSLQTLNVDQVQQITRTLLKKPQHYFVHQSPSAGRGLAAGVATKPSSAWRKGSAARESPVDGGNDNSGVLQPTARQDTTIDSLPAPPIVRDGKYVAWVIPSSHPASTPFLDRAWSTYVSTTGYPTPRALSTDTVAASYVDLHVAASSTLLSPMSSTQNSLSFLDYLRGFVVHCVATPLPLASPTPATPTAAAAPPSSKPTLPRTTPSTRTVIESKVKADVQARKQQVLRVRKTNTQRMHEALAKARLAAYEDAPSHPQTAHPHPPRLSSLGPGAKALEIAHLVGNSTFLQELPDEGEIASPDVASAAIRMELYGNPTQTTKEEGCFARPPPRQPKKPIAHDFKGWLGDFGAPHTKSVVPADWTDLEDEDTRWLQRETTTGRRRGWDLDNLFDDTDDTPADDQTSHPDILSHDQVDPAFEWLVHGV
ncbi:Aste57867_18593 [Aphanomyces stellatus]|uniref:Aste57867_18593 protein n=1 Tax=Aphanomyces stellatus TaxID=120398 RepID=A0A485LAU9_9STRA|nr:hypothetical protein As57867_018531 [Aphanomyces stellatus]VFT95328.1 Aste57867_18593 [Aphanomyces stellatus]